MRVTVFLTGLACAGALAGCASTTAGEGGRSEYQTLLSQCTERGGELKPIPGANNPNDGANYACEFRGSGPKPVGR